MSMENTTQPSPCVPPPASPIINQMLAIRHDVLAKEKQASSSLRAVHPSQLRSAQNLLHYLALRTHDLRELQLELSAWGLSSLGRAERKVLATLDAVLKVLYEFSNLDWKPIEHPPICFEEGRRMLEANTCQLMGPVTDGRRVRIMVTMPTEVATNYDLVKNLMSNGMNCARINCAHDDATVWEDIIKNIRKAQEVLERECKILMDLGGPKLRTGDLETEPTALKVRPRRNAIGKVLSAAQIWIFAEGRLNNAPSQTDAALSMPKDWMARLKKDDFICFTDARGSKRKLKVMEVSPTGCLTSCQKTVYFNNGISFQIVRKNTKLKKGKARLQLDIPPARSAIRLLAGDKLLLTRSQQPGRAARFDATGQLEAPAQIPCSLPEVFEDIRIGEPIWFDDGKIGGIITGSTADFITVTITHVPPSGGVLRSEKGINLPETELQLRALTEQDKADLAFVVKHADMVGLSFANRPGDVEELVSAMKEIQSDIPAVILKIETQLGFKNLPAMLLSAMHAPSCGVMIARGDLAIECGFGRLSEVQEQVLWTCEAAHVPVIWATQVLEGLAKTGLPTRAEVTDAAMGQRAECIMLNKGPHIVEATRALADILSRMQDHQTKKRSLLRKLRLAERFFEKH